MTTRTDRGLELYKERYVDIVKRESGMWTVPGSRKVPYVVDPVRGFCSCPDRSPVDEVCKHLVAVRLKAGRPEMAA